MVTRWARNTAAAQRSRDKRFMPPTRNGPINMTSEKRVCIRVCIGVWLWVSKACLSPVSNSEKCDKHTHRGAKDKAVQRMYGDRTEIVRWSCGYHTILRFLYDAFLLPCWRKKLYARCMISARPPHDDPCARTMPPTMCLRATILRFWKICITPR